MDRFRRKFDKDKGQIVSVKQCFFSNPTPLSKNPEHNSTALIGRAIKINEKVSDYKSTTYG